MKKLISLLMSLVLVSSMMPGIALTAFAESGDEGQVYTLTILWNDGGDISVLNNSDVLTKEYKTIGGKNACVLTFGEDVDWSQVNLEYELDNGYGLTNTTGPLSSYTNYVQGKECLSIYYSRWSFPSDEYEVTMEYTFGTSAQANSMFNSAAPNGVFTLDAVESAASGEYIPWEYSPLSDIVQLTLENRGLNTNIYSVDIDEKKLEIKVNNISYKYDCTFAYARSNATVLNKNKIASKTIIRYGYFRCEDTELIKLLFNGTGDGFVDYCNKAKEIISTYWDYEEENRSGGGDGIWAITDEEEIDLGSTCGLLYALKYNGIVYSYVEVEQLKVQTFFVPDDCAEKDVVSTVQQRIKQAIGKDISLEVAGAVSSFEDVDKLEQYGVDVDNLTNKYYKVEINDQEYYFIVERNSKKINSTSTECKHEKLVHHDAEEASCYRTGKIEYYCCTQCGFCFSDASATKRISGDTYTTIDPNKHSLVHHKARNSIGNRQGNIEYWSCSDCNKYFLDAEGEDETTYNKVILSAQTWDNYPHLDAENNILYTNGKEVTVKSDYSMVKFEFLDNDGDICNIYAPAGVTIFAGNVSEDGYSNIIVEGGIIGNIIVADTDLNTVQGYVGITINGGQVNTITLGGIEDQHSKALSANIVNNSSYAPNVVSGKYCGKHMSTSIINKNNLYYSLTGDFNLAEDVLTWSHTCYNGNKWYKLHTQGGTVEGETHRVYGKCQDLPVPTLEGSTFRGWSDLKYYYSEISNTDDSPYIYDVYAFYSNCSDTTPESVYLLKKNDKDQYVLQYPLTSGSKHNIYSTTISKYADIRDYAIVINEDKILSFEDQDNSLNEWCKVSDCYSKDEQQSETYCFKITRFQESTDYDTAVASLSISGSGAYDLDLSMLLYSNKLTQTVEIPYGIFNLDVQSVTPLDGEVECDKTRLMLYNNDSSEQLHIQINGQTYTITFKKTNISVGGNVEVFNSRLRSLSNSSGPINIKIADPAISGLDNYQSDLYNLLNSQMGSKYYLALYGLRTDPSVFSNSSIYLHQWNRSDQYIAGNTDLEEGVKYYWDPHISFSSEVDGVSYTTYTNVAIPFSFEYVDDIDYTAVTRIKENQALLDSNLLNLNNLYYKDVAILKNLLKGGNSLAPNLSQADTLHVDANTINNEALTSGTNLRIALSYGNIYADARESLFGVISATGYYYVDDVYYADLDCYDDLMYTEGIVTVPSGTRKNDVVEALQDKAEIVLADSGYTVNVTKVSATDLYSRYSDSDIPYATRAYFTEGGLALYSGAYGTSESNFVGYVEFPTGLGNVPDIDCNNIYTSEVLEYVNYGGYAERNVPSYQVYCVSTERNSAYVLAECNGTIPCEHQTLELVKEESATCLNDGHCTYYECTKCEAKFIDSEGKCKITDEEVITEHKTGHSLNHRNAKLPSKYNDGNTEYWECADCGEMFLDKDGNTPVEYSDIAIPAIGDAPYLDEETGILFLNGYTVYIDEYGGKTMATYYVGSQFENSVSFELPENVQIFVGNLDNDSKWMSELYVSGGHINNIILARASSISHTMYVSIMGGTVDKLTIGSVEGIRAVSSRFTVSNTSTCSPQVVVGQWNGKAITAKRLLSKAEVLDGEMTGSFQVSNEVKQLPYISINGKQAFLLKAEEGTFADGTKETYYYGKPEEIVTPKKSGASFAVWKNDYGTAITRYAYSYELIASYIDNNDPTPTSVVLEQQSNGGEWREYVSLNAKGGNQYTMECYIDNNSSYRVAVKSAGSTTQYFEVIFDADGYWSTSKKMYSKDGSHSATYTFAIHKMKDAGIEKTLYYEMLIGGSHIDGTYIGGSVDSATKNISIYVPKDALTVCFDYVYATGYKNIDYNQIINLKETTTTAQINCDSDTYTINIIRKNTSFYNTIDKKQDKLDNMSNLCRTVKIADPEITGLESCQLESILGDYYFSTLVLSQWGYDNDTGAYIKLYYDRDGHKEVNAEDVEAGHKYYALISDSWYSIDNNGARYSSDAITKDKLIPVKFEYVSTIDQSAVAKIKANDSLLKNLGDIDDSLVCCDVELLKNMIANEFSNSPYYYNTNEKEKILISSNKALYKALKGDTNLTISLLAGGSGDGGSIIKDVSASFYYSVDGVLYGKATRHQTYYLTQEMVVNVPTSTSTTKISESIRSKIERLFKNKTKTLTVKEITASDFATNKFPSATRAYVTEYGIALYSGTTGTSKSQFIGMEEDWLCLNTAPNFNELNLYSKISLGYIRVDDGTQINNVKAYQVYEINYGGNTAYVLANIADVVCEHESVSHHEALDADCFTDGNTEYYECVDCGNYFSDSTCKNQIAKNSWVIAKGHKVTKHVSRDATCTEDGNTAYWHCAECGRYFSDKEGNNEIVKDSWIVKKVGHNLIHYEASESTCKNEGNIEYWQCSNCGKLYLDDKAISELYQTDIIIPKSVHKWNEGTIIEIQEKSAIVEYECVDCHQKKTGHLKIKARVKTEETEPLTEENLSNNLKDKGLTATKVKDAMIDEAKKVSGISSERIDSASKLTQELSVEISSDNGSSYEKMTADNTPEGGVSVVIPYPEGTDSSYDFILVHMYDKDVADHKTGDIEVFSNPVKTKTGLKITLESASPIQIISMQNEGKSTIDGFLTGFSGLGDVKYEISSNSLETKTVFQSNDGEYSFKGLAAGQYTLTVSADGDYVEREYTVDIEENGDVERQIVSIFELGDVTTDGARDAADITKIARQVARISLEPDAYVLKLYDIDKNDDIQMADATKLARFVTGIISSL